MDSLLAEPQGKPKDTGVGSLSLLQLIFLTQELNQGLLHCRWILYQLSYQGSPVINTKSVQIPSHKKQNLTKQTIGILEKSFLSGLRQLGYWESQFLGRLIGTLGVPKERGVWNSQGGRKDIFLSPHCLGLYNNNVSCLRSLWIKPCYLKMLIMGVDLVFTRMYLAWGQCYLKM